MLAVNEDPGHLTHRQHDDFDYNSCPTCLLQDLFIGTPVLSKKERSLSVMDHGPGLLTRLKLVLYSSMAGLELPQWLPDSIRSSSESSSNQSSILELLSGYCIVIRFAIVRFGMVSPAAARHP
jgi:hypothetical protein